MKKKLRTISALMLSALLATAVLPFSKVEAKSKWVEIDGVNYEINRMTGECEASLNVKQGKSEVRIPNKVSYQGDTYKVTFFSWDDWEKDWREETSRTYKPAAGSYQAVLEKITIAKGVRVSEPACHYQKLKTIIFEDPAGVSGTEFYDCPQLQSLYIPKKVKYWPTVRKCPKVKITVSSANPYLKVINNDIYSKNGKVLYSVASTKASYKVRKSVKEIEDGAFYKNDSIKSIYLPDSVKEIGEEAFGDMQNLTTVRFSKSVKELDYAMFNKCKKLKTVRLPKTIQTIRGNFGGKKNCYLKKVYINATSLKKSNLKSLPKKCRIYVKNKTVKKQVKSAGFKGKIVVLK